MAEDIFFDHKVCQDLNQTLAKEWIESNGIGGYASSTLSGINTRRYHGLLIGAIRPPHRRLLYLNSLEECIDIEGEKFDLSSHLYPNTIHPRGYELLHEFHLWPYPTWIYRIEDMEIEKNVLLIRGENTVLIRYCLRNAEVPVRLEIRPLVAVRDHHSLMREQASFSRELVTDKGRIRLHPVGDLPPLFFYHHAAIVDKSGYWYKNFQYPKELERGLDFEEDLYCPFGLIYSFLTSQEIFIAASLIEKENFDFLKAAAREKERRERKWEAIPVKERPWALLWYNADSFLVEGREGEKTLLAGYPWFSDWGRDALISLHGLTLTTGKQDWAKGVLRYFSQFTSQGMIPNYFPEASETPLYNTVDGTLWFFQALFDYDEATEDTALVEKLYPELKKMIRHYESGQTRFGIRREEDGLLSHGGEGMALTWMDAQVEGRPITPRNGKAVEINALWYNALRIIAFFSDKLGIREEKAQFESLARKARESFNRHFWNEEKKCLYDFILGTYRDPSVRPNQIFAISLSFPVLEEKYWPLVMAKVEEDLLTPFGLRTLSREDPHFVGRYEGDSVRRDKAYHQGTVWPWLLGPFVSAYLKTYGKNREIRVRIKRYLEPLLDYLETEGMGTVPEIFDGEEPHSARGAISQAWSVAELLHCYELLKEERRSERPREIILH